MRVINMTVITLLLHQHLYADYLLHIEQVAYGATKSNTALVLRGALTVCGSHCINKTAMYLNHLLNFNNNRTLLRAHADGIHAHCHALRSIAAPVVT